MTAIWLPCVFGDCEGGGREVHRAVPRGSGEIVLVIEPDHERLLRHEEVLAALGYEPWGFSGVAEAVSACHDTPAHSSPGPTKCDAVLLGSPSDGDRAATLRRCAILRENLPGLPLILAAASTSELDAPALAQAGICEVIQQPVASTELAPALARCLPVR